MTEPTEKFVGAGVPVGDDELVSDVLVVAKVIDLDGNEVTRMGHTEGTGWVTGLGLAYALLHDHFHAPVD